MKPTRSYLKVPYDLRPAKQVERRMLMDALQILSMEGFPVRDYQYTGMGSVYFFDFILFHKLLGIERMVSVEHDTKVQKRVQFNRPFGLVTVKMGRVGDYIPELSPDLRHILWLDYDDILLAEHLQDVALAGTYLTPGSIFAMTIDVEPPTPVEEGGTPGQWQQHFAAVAGPYMDPKWQATDFALSNLPRINVTIIENALRSGLSGRTEVRFQPLFNFLYADGHLMATVGGMIGSATDCRRVQGSRLKETAYGRFDLEEPPCDIRVPRLTRKERAVLDAALPCKEGWLPKEFELRNEDMDAYRRIYRFFPAYGELLV